MHWTTAGLWLAVVASGLYHGINPGMGGPLAVSAGLMERRSRAVGAPLWPLTAAHPLPNNPGSGWAARRFGWIDGKEFACLGSRALAANGRPPARDAPGDPSLRGVGYPRRMAALDTDRRQPPCHRVRYLPASRPAPSTGIGADTTDATGALVVRRSDRAWCRFDARADLSWTLPASRPRQRP